MNKKFSTAFSWFRSRPTWLWLTVILVFNFLLKLLCWYLDPVVSRDGCLYIHLAQIWHDTGNFQDLLKEYQEMWLPPLLLYLMKCLLEFGFSAEFSGVVLSLVTGTFSPLLTYGIAREVTQNKRIALGSAILAAVHPTLNNFSHEVQRDMLYLFFIGIAIWLLTAGIRRQKWYCWLGSGLVCGCAMLTRFETLEFLILVPLALCLACAGKYCPWKKGLGYAGLFFFCFFGSVFASTVLMQTQDYLFSNYKKYYQTKFEKLEQQFSPEYEETTK